MLTGCQLGGRILNTMGGTLTDVQFAPNAHLIGGMTLLPKNIPSTAYKIGGIKGRFKLS